MIKVLCACKVNTNSPVEYRSVFLKLLIMRLMEVVKVYVSDQEFEFRRGISIVQE
jgi:hypothetical protein